MLFTSDYSVKMPLGQTILTALIGISTVLIILAVIALLIMIVSRIIRAIEKAISDKQAVQPEASASPSATSSGTPLPSNTSQGQVDLVGVDEPTAAVIMALVSHQSGIELNRLCFKSIKLSEDEKK